MTRPEPDPPRLVYDADAPRPASGRDSTQSPGSPPAPDRPSRRRALGILFGVLLLATSFAAIREWRRATALATRVDELSAQLIDARNEIAARRAQIEMIRGSLADVRQRITALESVAAADPTAPPAA